MTTGKSPRAVQLLAAPLQRRMFLFGTLAVAGLWATGLTRFPALTPKRSLVDLHLADFEILRGDYFHLYGQDRQIRTVQLDIVKDQRRHAVSPQHECFLLAFCAPAGLNLLQETYTFAHPKLGYFDLFIVPSQFVAHEERYIAIINRI